MFDRIKTFLMDRGYFKINWVVRKIAWSVFATLVVKTWIAYLGANTIKSISGAAGIVFCLAIVKEFTESLGQPDAVWTHFKEKGIKDLVPVMIGVACAAIILIMKSKGM